MSKYLDAKKYIVLAILVAFQVGLFLMLKLYFFAYFESQVRKS